MLTLEEQIERVAAIATAEAAARPRPNDRDIPRRRVSGTHSLVGVAAAVLVVGLVGGLVWIVSGRTEPPAVTNPSALPQRQPGPTLPLNEPTLAADPDQDWLTPTWLPDGLSFDYAMYGFGLGQSLSYVDSDGQESLVVRSDTPMVQSLRADETVEVNGVDWSYSTTETDESSESHYLFRMLGTTSEVGPVGVLISSDTLGRDAIVEVAGSLDTVPATELPRPPLPVSLEPNSGTVVAEATADGVPKRLAVDTDGRYFAMSVGGAGGSPVVLRPMEFINWAGAQGPNPNLVLTGNEAESLIWGLLHPDVATVDVELTDGRIITTIPQDDYGFAENFYLAAFPTRTEGGLELLAALVARDADGNELQRTSGPGSGPSVASEPTPPIDP